jgi:Ca-activated chloride channel family protein
MKNFEFAHRIYLYALLLIPLLVVIYFVLSHHKKKQLQQFISRQLQPILIPEISWSMRAFKYILLSLALAFVILALARPRFGSKLKDVKKEGIEIIIALDVSNSMLAEDIKPNRLERAKQAIYQMIDKLSNDRIGIIVFAGDAYTQIPVTSDYSSAQLFLQGISPDMVPKAGHSYWQCNSFSYEIVFTQFGSRKSYYYYN